MLHRKAVVLSLIVVAALALSGCGEPPPPERVTVAFTGTEGIRALFENTVQLALDEYHERGIGVPVEIVWMGQGTEEDPYGLIDVEIERAAVQRAVDDPDVVAIIGGTTSSMVQVGIPISNEGGVAYLSGGAYWAGLTQPGYGPGEPGIYYPTGVRNFFRMCARDDTTTRAMAAFLVEQLGAESVYIANHATQIAARSFAGQFELAAMDADMEVIALEELDPTVQDEVEALAARIVDAQPDVLYVSGVGIDSLVYAVRALDPGLAIVGTEITDIVLNEPPEGRTLADLEGIYYQDQYPHPSLLDTEEARAFIAAYEPRYGELDSTWGGQFANAHEATSVVLYAIERAEEPTREGVLRSLQNLGTYSGIYGDWTFTPYGDMTIGFSLIHQLQGGEWHMVDFTTREQD